MNIQGVVLQNVFMCLTYLMINERKIDRTTPDRDQINLGPKPLPLLRPFSVMTSSQKLLVQTQASQAHVSTKSKLFIYESVTRCVTIY